MTLQEEPTVATVTPDTAAPVQGIEDVKEVVIDAKTKYTVPKSWELIRKVGSEGEKVAVKKIQNAFDDLIDGKRILREIKLLRHFNHDNIIRIMHMFPPLTGHDNNVDFDDIYIVTDLMETDLHRVIYSKQVLTEEHHQYFTYQTLRGVKYLHSANVIHRDLKPSNILVNKNCDLKICDFGLARGLENDKKEDDPTLTDYVVTRWYRAPEVVLLASEYTKAIDVWSVGCILCELMGRKPIFTGKDHLDQIKKIISVIGTPSEEDKSWLPANGAASRFVQKCALSKGTEFNVLYPSASREAHDIAEQMLKFSPNARITVENALSHPFFQSLHQSDDEPEFENMDGTKNGVNWEFDNFTPTKEILQNRVYMETANYTPDIIKRDLQNISDRPDLVRDLKKDPVFAAYL